MQIVFVLWLVKRYVVYRGATRLDKSLENYSCLTAASYKVSIALRSAFFTLVQPCILYKWGVPVGKMKRVLCSDRYLSSYPLGVSRFYLAQDKRLRCEDLQSL